MKKFILSVISLFCNFIAFGQTVYSGEVTVTGDVSALTASGTLSVTFSKLAGGYEFDSAVIKDGRFSIKKELKEPVILSVSLRAAAGKGQGQFDYYSIYLLPGTAMLTAKGSLRESVLTGTIAAANKEYRELNESVNLYIKKHNDAVGSLKKTDESQAELEKRRRTISDSIMLLLDEEVYKPFIASKPGSPVAVYALLQYAARPIRAPRKKLQPEKIQTLAATLPQATRTIPSLLQLGEELKVSVATGAGKPIIDFTLADTAGKTVRFSDFKGQYVFLDFWASWCAPCRRENPNIVRQFNKYKDKGFTVLSVSLDKPAGKQAWLDAITQDHLEGWTHVSDLKGFDSEVARMYYVRSIPTNFLISPDGIFLGRNLHGDELEKQLEILLP